MLVESLAVARDIASRWPSRPNVIGVDERDLKVIAGEVYDELPFRFLSQTRPEFVRRFVNEAKGPGVMLCGMCVRVVTREG